VEEAAKPVAVAVAAAVVAAEGAEVEAAEVQVGAVEAAAAERFIERLRRVLPRSMTATRRTIPVQEMEEIRRAGGERRQRPY
jgi:hypothetical protein